MPTTTHFVSNDKAPAGAAAHLVSPRGVQGMQPIQSAPEGIRCPSLLCYCKILREQRVTKIYEYPLIFTKMTTLREHIVTHPLCGITDMRDSVGGHYDYRNI